MAWLISQQYIILTKHSVYECMPGSLTILMWFTPWHWNAGCSWAEARKGGGPLQTDGPLGDWGQEGRRSAPHMDGPLGGGDRLRWHLTHTHQADRYIHTYIDR